MEKVNKLGNRKTIQTTDIPVNILTFLEITFVTFLMYVLIKVRFRLFWNMLTLHLSLKKRIQWF